MPFPAIIPAIGSAIKAIGASKIGSAIAGGVGKLVAGAAGSYVGRRIDLWGDQRSRTNEYDFLRSKGLTPQEIAGAGAPGTGSTGGSTVLGNQMAALQSQAMQQGYDAEQRALDRQVAERGQDMGLASAQTAAGAQIYGANIQQKIADANLALASDRFTAIELPQAVNDYITSTPEWKRQELLARMGVDNILATVLSSSRGIDVMDTEALAAMPDEEFQKLVVDVIGLRSTIFTEAAGMQSVADKYGSGGSDALKGITQALNPLGATFQRIQDFFAVGGQYDDQPVIKN